MKPWIEALESTVTWKDLPVGAVATWCGFRFKKTSHELMSVNGRDHVQVQYMTGEYAGTGGLILADEFCDPVVVEPDALPKTPVVEPDAQPKTEVEVLALASRASRTQRREFDAGPEEWVWPDMFIVPPGTPPFEMVIVDAEGQPTTVTMELTPDEAAMIVAGRAR